ncbi:hypothetical protein LIA77_03037 [Sarocladium implicatum]|nr:hypothetical protein LIA77_03037 [Sarocladium implicatum]
MCQSQNGQGAGKVRPSSTLHDPPPIQSLLSWHAAAEDTLVLFHSRLPAAVAVLFLPRGQLWRQACGCTRASGS